MRKWSTKAELSGLLLLFALAIWLVDPAGDFPLNDDWHYGLLVKSLVEEGRFILDDEISPNMLWQPYWGYLFSWLGGGFSFESLRWSTLVLAVSSIVLFYFLLALGQTSAEERRWATLIFAFSPVLFLLSFTFMTDIPFLAMVLASWLAFRLYLIRGKRRFLWAAYLLAIGAYGMRLPGILLIPCFHLAMYVEDPRSRKRALTLGMSVVGSFAVVLFFEEGLKPLLGLRSVFRSAAEVAEARVDESISATVSRIGKAGLGTLGNMGLWLLPLLPWTWRNWRPPGTIPRGYLFSGLLLGNLVLIVSAAWVYRGFPYVGGGNIFYNFGLGPLLLADIRYWGWPSGLTFPTWAIFGLGAMAQAHCCLLIWLLVRKSIVARQRFYLFLILFSLIYLAALGAYSFFDRYLLPLFAAVLLIAVETYRTRMPAVPTIFLFLAMSWFTLAGAHDYLSWNRTANDLYRHVVTTGVPPPQIDGGVAINGLQLHRTGNPSATYTLTLRAMNDVAVVRKAEWYSWLHGTVQNIYVLRNPYRQAEYPDLDQQGGGR